MKNISKICLIVICLMLVPRGVMGEGGNGDGDTITFIPLPLEKDFFQLRVSLLEDYSKVAISGDRGMIVVDPQSGETILSSRAYVPWWLQAENKSVRLLSSGIYKGALLIKPKGDGRLRLSHRPGGTDKIVSRWYRGSIEIWPLVSGLLAVNVIDLEDYLYGVLPAEMGPNSPLEALKAQAVASRTFALHRKLNRRQELYDLDSTIISQVYGGSGYEDENANRAVDMTRGLVLTYDGNPIPAYYHSNSGGYTEDMKYVWGGESLPYLRSIADPFGQDGSRYEWNARLNLKRIGEMLKTAGIEVVEEIQSIGVSEVSPSNRVTELRIVHRQGETTIKGNRFRLALDPLFTIKSTMFSIKQFDSVLEFSGYGSGHGVGLSQESAKVMAEKGLSFRAILDYFYPGTELGKVYRNKE